jgi:hypothetical protein
VSGVAGWEIVFVVEVGRLYRGGDSF